MHQVFSFDIFCGLYSAQEKIVCQHHLDRVLVLSPSHLEDGNYTIKSLCLVSIPVDNDGGVALTLVMQIKIYNR